MANTQTPKLSWHSLRWLPLVAVLLCFNAETRSLVGQTLQFIFDPCAQTVCTHTSSAGAQPHSLGLISVGVGEMAPPFAPLSETQVLQLYWVAVLVWVGLGFRRRNPRGPPRAAMR